MISAKLRAHSANLTFTTNSNTEQIVNPVTGDRMTILRSTNDTNGEYVKFYIRGKIYEPHDYQEHPEPYSLDLRESHLPVVRIGTLGAKVRNSSPSV